MTETYWIAVIGGFFTPRFQDDPAEMERAAETGRRIGAALATQGFGLVVYFSNGGSLEPYVVSGYCEAAANIEAGGIRVRYARSQRKEVRFAEQDDPTYAHLFEIDIFPGDQWEAPFYRSLAERDAVDCVLLMAGGTSTRIAGQIAIARDLPVLAVDRFGGSAEEIHEQLAAADSREHPHWDQLTADQHVARLRARTAKLAKVRADEAARIALREEFYKVETMRARHAGWLGNVLALIAVFLGIALLRELSLGQMLFLTVLAAMAGGSAGALARLATWDPAARDRFSSAILGAFAGLVVGIAYMAPQLVSDLGDPAGADGLLSRKLEANHLIQMFFTLGVAVPAGIGFDTIMSRLRERAKDVTVDATTRGGAGRPASDA